MSTPSSRRCGRRSAAPAPIPAQPGEAGRPARRARRGGAPVARLGRPLAPAPPGGAWRARHARQGRAPQADALVRRAARVRPAVVQRRVAPARRRPRTTGREPRGGGGAAPLGGDALERSVRIAVLRPQVPFARGGAEIFTDELVDELRTRGHEADLVSVPFKWYPGTRVLTQAFLWRMLDLDEADGRRIDVVVATKFPSYVVRHPEKRVWLVHQFRQAYELDGTELGQFGPSAEDRALRRQVQELDRARARRGHAPLRDLGERRRPARALDGSRRGGAAAPAAGALLPERRRRRASSSRRAGSTGRSGSTSCSRERRSTRAFDVVVVVRRPRPRAARGPRPRQGPRRSRALRGPRRRGAARRAVRDVLGGVLRAGRRGLRDGPVRGVPLGQAGDHDDAMRAGRWTSSTTGGPGSSSTRPPPPSARRRRGSTITPTRRPHSGPRGRRSPTR